jgi:hypothetical protein
VGVRTRCCCSDLTIKPFASLAQRTRARSFYLQGRRSYQKQQFVHLILTTLYRVRVGRNEAGQFRPLSASNHLGCPPALGCGTLSIMAACTSVFHLELAPTRAPGGGARRRPACQEQASPRLLYFGCRSIAASIGSRDTAQALDGCCSSFQGGALRAPREDVRDKNRKPEPMSSARSACASRQITALLDRHSHSTPCGPRLGSRGSYVLKIEERIARTATRARGSEAIYNQLFRIETAP